jgi:uncharacterized membrane protein YqjE
MTEPFQAPGLGDHLRGLALGGLGYLRARLELLGLEGKQALTQVGAVLLLGALALTLSIAGYLLLCLAVVFGLASFSKNQNTWIWIAFFVGGLHVALAWLILRWARQWLQEPMFPTTVEEFRKDEAWLKRTAERQR